MCNWVTLLYSPDWHDIVKQLYFNQKKKEISPKRKKKHHYVLNDKCQLTANPQGDIVIYNKKDLFGLCPCSWHRVPKTPGIS